MVQQQENSTKQIGHSTLQFANSYPRLLLLERTLLVLESQKPFDDLSKALNVMRVAPS